MIDIRQPEAAGHAARVVTEAQLGAANASTAVLRTVALADLLPTLRPRAELLLAVVLRIEAVVVNAAVREPGATPFYRKSWKGLVSQ